jgi:phasin family protein
MLNINEKISTEAKRNLEAHLDIWTAFATKTIDNVAKLAELNMSFLKDSLDESRATRQQLLSINEPTEMLSIAAAHSQPRAEKVLAYGNELVGITVDTQSDLIETTQKEIAETHHEMAQWVEGMASKAPDSSRNAMSILKSAIDNANTGYEQFAKTAKQATETFQANMAMTSSAFKGSSGKKSHHAKA